MHRQIVLFLIVLFLITITSCGRTPSSQAHYRVMSLLKTAEYDQALRDINRRLEKAPHSVSLLEDQLLLWLANENPPARDEVLKTQKRLDSLGAGRRLLLEQGKNRLPLVRQRTAYAIGAIREISGLTILKDLAEDREQEVRAEAIHALAKLNQPSARNLLMIHLRDGYWKVRAESADALAKLGDPSSTKQLFRAVDDPDDYARMQITSAALAVAHSSQTDFYFEQIESDNTSRKTVAARALAKIQRPEAAAILLDLLKDPQVQDRLAIARSLTTPGLGGTEPLAKNLANLIKKERNPQVKEVLNDYLRRLQEKADGK